MSTDGVITTALVELTTSQSSKVHTDVFQWYDYLIFIVTLFVSLGIGIYYALVEDKSVSSYFMGNRTLSAGPVSVSMLMSYVSAILVLGNTAEMYSWGLQMILAAVGYCIGAVLAALLFVPLFFRLQITSVFEMRFRSHSVKLTGSLLFIVSQIIYMGIAVFSPATALDAVTGIPTWVSIVATGVVATIYTAIGGMKAVVWTDVFQGAVLIFGCILVVIIACIRVGGFSEIFLYLDQGDRLRFNFDLNPGVRLTVWTAIFGEAIARMALIGTNQTSVQRFCSVSTLKKSKMSVYLTIPSQVVTYFLTSMCGLAVFAYYEKLGCDPLRTSQVDNPNQLLPYFIVNVIKLPALPGLFVAVLFSGALSSLSSSLNSLCAVTWIDILQGKCYRLSEFRQGFFMRAIVVLYGVAAVCSGFIAKGLGSHVLQLVQSFFLGTSGPLLGMFVLGACFPCSTWIGALAGGWSGLACTLVVAIGATMTRPRGVMLPTNITCCDSLGLNVTRGIPENTDVFPIFRLSFMLYGTLGMVICVLVGLVVSFLTGAEKPTDQNPDHIIPIFDRLFCCLPESIRNKTRCGLKQEEFDETDQSADQTKGEESNKMIGMTETRSRDQQTTTPLMS